MIDQAIIEFDKALRTVFASARSVRAMPGEGVPDAELGAAERSHAAALMRVNHVGEVCAQALYQGQSIMSREPAIRDTLRQAAQEETEHLAWTERRIAELGDPHRAAIASTVAERFSASTDHKYFVSIEAEDLLRRSQDGLFEGLDEDLLVDPLILPDLLQYHRKVRLHLCLPQSGA